MVMFSVPWVPERVLSRDKGRAFARRVQASGTALTPEQIAVIRENFASPASARPLLEYYRQSVRTALRGGLPTYPTIRQPGLLLWGEGDVVLDTELIAPHTRYAHDLSIRRVPVAGHFVQCEAAEAVNEVLSGWLAERRSAESG